MMSNIWIQQLFSRPLYNLGADGNDALNDIFSPRYSKELIERYMTGHYESPEGAGSQAEKLNLTSYYRGLIAEAMEIINFKSNSSSCPTVLEIGCGFGNATFPLLQLMPQAQLVATELSASMLCILKEKIKIENVGHRCALMQLNAEQLDFKTATFDLVVGAAILHHLFDPSITIKQCATILKPGGVAIFFEPFENGFGIMGIIYRSILRDPRSWLLSREARYYFKNTFNIWQKMKSSDKNDPFFARVDDKWLFTREFFTQQAKNHGFSSVNIHTLNKSNEPFLQFAEEHIKGNNVGKLPHWVWSLIRDYDHLFSRELKMDLLTEGCIIFKK